MNHEIILLHVGIAYIARFLLKVFKKETLSELKMKASKLEVMYSDHCS